jgi:hypothetical protein
VSSYLIRSLPKLNDQKGTSPQVKIEDEPMVLEQNTRGDISWKTIYESNTHGENVEIIVID